MEMKLLRLRSGEWHWFWLRGMCVLHASRTCSSSCPAYANRRAVGGSFGPANGSPATAANQRTDRLHHADGQEVPSRVMPIPVAEQDRDDPQGRKGQWVHAVQCVQAVAAVPAVTTQER